MNDLIDSKEYEKESTKFKHYLNYVVGIVTFSFALTALSFNDPQCVAWFISPIVVYLMISSPKFNTLLRAKSIVDHAVTLEDKKLLQKYILEITNKEESKLKIFFNVIIYLYGMLFYFAVLFNPQFTAWIKAF